MLGEEDLICEAELLSNQITKLLIGKRSDVCFAAIVSAMIATAKGSAKPGLEPESFAFTVGKLVHSLWDEVELIEGETHG